MMKFVILNRYSTVRERIENRSFPSVFQAWANIIGLDHLTWEQRNVLHDLHFAPSFDYALGWDITPTEPTYGVATSMAGALTRAQKCVGAVLTKIRIWYFWLVC